MTRERKDRLVAMLRELGAGEAERETLTVEKSGDFGDIAGKLSSQDLAGSLLRHRKGIKEKIEEALSLGEDDCSECGERISAGRLVAVPWAVRCVGCEEKRERDGEEE